MFTGGQEPVLEASISSVEIKTSSAEAVWAATGTLGSVQVMMHSFGSYLYLYLVRLWLLLNNFVLMLVLYAHWVNAKVKATSTPWCCELAMEIQFSNVDFSFEFVGTSVGTVWIHLKNICVMCYLQIKNLNRSHIISEADSTCTTPLLYGPLDNSSVFNIEKFTTVQDPSSAVVTDDLVRFTVQIPTNPSMAAGRHRLNFCCQLLALFVCILWYLRG